MSSYFETLKSLKNDILVPASQDMIRSAPDSLFLGSGILALLTQNYPLGILTLAMVEFGLLQRVLGGLFGTFSSNTAPLPKSDVCIPGIPSPYQISAIGTILTGATFPNGPVFFLAATLSYIFLSTINFKQELNELGKREPDWKGRIPLAVTFTSILIVGLIVFRVMYGCESPLVIIGSIVFGGAAGALVQLLHTYLFGRDSINFLGVPLLADRAANGRPLYVCAKQ